MGLFPRKLYQLSQKKLSWGFFVFVLLLGSSVVVMGMPNSKTTATGTAVLSTPPLIVIGADTSKKLPGRDDVMTIKNEGPVVFNRTFQTLLVYCWAPYPIEWKTSSHVLQIQPSVYKRVLGGRDELGPQQFLAKANKTFIDQSPYEINPLKTTTLDNSTFRILQPHNFFYHLGLIIRPVPFGYIGSCQSIQKPEKHTQENSSTSSTPVLKTKLHVFNPAPEKDSPAWYFIGEGRRFKIINRSKIKNPDGSGSSSGFVVPCPASTMRIEEAQKFKFSLLQIFNENQDNENRTVIDETKYKPEVGFYLEEWEKLEGTFQCHAQPRSQSPSTWNETVTFEFIQNSGQYQSQNEDWLDITEAEHLDFQRRKHFDMVNTNNTNTGIKINFQGNEGKCAIDNNGISGSELMDSQQSEFFVVECKTLLLCQIFRPCSSKLCGWVTNKEDCNTGSCESVESASASAFWKCTLGGNQNSAYSFTDFNHKKCTDYISSAKDKLPPPSALIIRLNLAGNGDHRKNMNPKSVSNTLELYTHRSYRFEYFSMNRTDIWSDRLEIEAEFKLTSDMTAVVCLAPWSNSPEWMEAVQNVTVRVPSFPKINETEGPTFRVGEEGRTLTCSATGDPEPTFKWLNENETVLEIGKIFNFRTTITKAHKGVYICEASNDLGADRQKFIVKVKETGLTKSEKFGIIFAILIFMATLALTLYKYLKTRKQLRLLTADEIDEFVKGRPDKLKNVEIQGENAYLLPFNKAFEIPVSDFSIDEDQILGSGEFGVVYSGKLHDLPVAIKTTKCTVDVEFFKAFLKEIKVMTFIGKHPNVVQLLGTSTSRIRERIVFVLVELGVHGNLNSFLMKHQSNFMDTLSSSQLFNVAPEKLIPSAYANVTAAVSIPIKITTRDFIKWCGQIAAGMSHLAFKKIIHGDLAPRNILLFDDYTAKITDFGLSRQLYTSKNYTKSQQSPLPWRIMAPESLKYLEFSTKSDVWSFGVLVWEMFSLGTIPYAGSNWTQDFIDDLEQGLRLPKPKWASNKIYENMCDCWIPLPEERPDFEQLEKYYNDILFGIDNDNDIPC